jgi:hypothetical protein
VELGDRIVGVILPADRVADPDEHQRAAAPALLGTVLDRRGARHRIADAQRLVEGELAAGPHPSRQSDRGQEAAAPGMAVGPDLRLPRQRQE